MPNESFVGKVEVGDTKSNFTTEFLDGDHASGTVGGRDTGIKGQNQPVPAFDGRLDVFDKMGKHAVSIDASQGGEITLYRPSGKQGAQLTGSSFYVGGNGAGGSLV